MTYPEAKDQIAKEQGFYSWPHFYTSFDLRKLSSKKAIEFYSNKAAELYAKSKDDEIEALKSELSILKEYSDKLRAAANNLCQVIHKQSMATWTTPEYEALEETLNI